MSTEIVGCLRFKTARQRREWDSDELPAVLRQLVLRLAWRRWCQLELLSTVTEIKTTLAEDQALGRKSATHREWRAVDVRAHGGRLAGEELVREWMCRDYPTGLRKMPRIAPLVHGNGPHYHVQITRAEKRRGEL